MQSNSTHPKRGIFYLLAAFTVLICLDASTKYTVQTFPVLSATWSRYVGHMVVVLALAAPGFDRSLWQTKNLPMQLLRGAFLALMSVLFFAAIKTLPLATTTAILFLSPILITLWAQLFLGEAVSGGSWFAVFLGFVGVLVICRPGGGVDPVGAGYALAAAFCNSIYQTLTRKMSGDSPLAQLFFAGLVGSVALSTTLPLWWTPVTTTALHWVIFCALGVVGGFGHWLLAKAYQHASASTLTPWMYSQLLLSIVLGWWVFGDVPDRWAVLGMALVVLAPQVLRLKVWRRA